MTTLGKYELHEQLGKGGFGSVYRATDTSLGREVALKMLHPQLMVDDEFILRFRREAKVLASLDNNHIVTIYEMGEVDARIFIAMRYLSGGNLKDLIKENGTINYNEAALIMTQIANGLGDAHAKGLVHRDLKPENILFDSHGEAVITDFGLVKAVTEGSSLSIDRIVGTPNYIAPEIWLGKSSTPASDVYSLGCVFYEMITGIILFNGDSLPEIMKKHFDELVLPEKWFDGVPAGILEVMQKALSKTREERFQTVDDFLNSLLEINDKPLEQNEEVPVINIVEELSESIEQNDEQEKLPPLSENPGDNKFAKFVKKIQKLCNKLSENRKTKLYVVTASILLLCSISLILAISTGNSWNISGANKDGFYYSSNIEGHDNIYFYYKNNSTQKVTASEKFNDLDPVVTANGTVYFSCNRFDNKVEVCALNTSGKMTRVTTTLGSFESWDPAPTGRGFVYFTSNRSGHNEIFVMDNDGKITKIFNSDKFLPTWDPAPDRFGNLYFTSETDQNLAEIFVLTKEGKVQQVTSSGDGYQSWDPTPAKNGYLYFSSDRSAGLSNIFGFDKFSKLTQITQSTMDSSNWNPIPDTTGKLFFTSNRESEIKIFNLSSNGIVRDVIYTPGNFIDSTPYFDAIK